MRFVTDELRLMKKIEPKEMVGGLGHRHYDYEVEESFRHMWVHGAVGCNPSYEDSMVGGCVSHTVLVT